MSRKKNGKPKKSWKRRSKPGDAPGQILVDPTAAPTIIKVIALGSEFLEKQILDVHELDSITATYQRVWVDVVGLGSEQTLRTIANMFHLHPLVIEDVVNVYQRAKVEEFDDGLFIVARMVDGDDPALTEQISIYLKGNVLISFQERPGDCWEPLRQRLRQRRGKVAINDLDYLLYSLLDAVVDSYFPVLEKVVEQVDDLEQSITEQVSTEQMARIHDLRGQLLALRRSIRPHREMINELVRDSIPHIHPETRVHLRDCYDHVIQVVDAVDTYREVTSDLRDFYLSSVSNSMNEVMKLLTIISTIFIPLSFVAGVYGMNFDPEVSPWNMPELKWRFGYFFSLAIMALMASGLLIYFRRRRWI
ncbi:MAG: magnesium/cobalt transporter CorA [Pirellula sp.]|jgi:magnesium transporter